MTDQALPLGDSNGCNGGFHPLKRQVAKLKPQNPTNPWAFSKIRPKSPPIPGHLYDTPLLCCTQQGASSPRPAVHAAVCNEPRRTCFAFLEASSILQRLIKKHNLYQTSLVISIKNCSHMLGFFVLKFQHLKYYESKAFWVPACLHRWSYVTTTSSGCSHGPCWRLQNYPTELSSGSVWEIDTRDREWTSCLDSHPSLLRAHCLQWSKH